MVPCRRRAAVLDPSAAIGRIHAMATTDIPQRVLLGPGPSDVPPRVLQALAKPTIGHLDPVFLKVMDEVRTRLREVFRTKNEIALAAAPLVPAR